MKKVLSQILFLISILYAAVPVTAQRINPTTQIQKAPGNAPGYILRSKSTGELEFVLNTAILSGSGAPSGAPPAGSTGIYLNTSTGIIYTWNGTTWNEYVGKTNLSYTAAANTGTVFSDNGADAVIPSATTSLSGLMSSTDKSNLEAVDNVIGVAPGATNMGNFTGGILPNNADIKTLLQSIGTNISSGGQSENGLSGVGLSANKYRLGGSLNQNTMVLGSSGTYSLSIDSTSSFRATAAKQTGSGVVSNIFARSGTASSGILLNTWNMNDATKLSGLNLDDNALYGVFYDNDGVNGPDYGFMITPDPVGVNAKLHIKTPDVKSGSAIDGQVLTLVDAASGEVEYTTFSGGGSGTGESENGISGIGSTADKYRLGGSLNQNTVIDGADFGYTLNNAGTVLLESDNTSGAVKSELLLSSSNILGSYLRSVNKSNAANVSQLSLDVDGIHGLQWKIVTGEELGFLINPNTTTNTSGVSVATRNHALGTATTGQVLTLQSDGTVEYENASGGGGSISTYSAGSGAVVTATGSGVTFTRTTASVWTFEIPSGVELISFDINSNASQSATAALDIDFVFAGSRPYNQDASADMTDSKIPVITTLKKITPATYPTTAAGNNAAWSADVTTSGTLRISTTEFGEVSSAGANATSIKGVF